MANKRNPKNGGIRTLTNSLLLNKNENGPVEIVDDYP
jgi:hypothetical protein